MDVDFRSIPEQLPRFPLGYCLGHVTDLVLVPPAIWALALRPDSCGISFRGRQPEQRVTSGSTCVSPACNRIVPLAPPGIVSIYRHTVSGGLRSLLSRFIAYFLVDVFWGGPNLSQIAAYMEISPGYA